MSVQPGDDGDGDYACVYPTVKVRDYHFQTHAFWFVICLSTRRHCMLPLNRDKDGAINIGHSFQRLMRDESPIKAMTEEEGGLSPRTNVQ